jgi:hypothetical protein
MVFKVQLWVYYRLSGSNAEMPERRDFGKFETDRVPGCRSCRNPRFQDGRIIRTWISCDQVYVPKRHCALCNVAFAQSITGMASRPLLVGSLCGVRHKGCNSCRRVQLVASPQVVGALAVVVFSVPNCDAHRSVHC